MALTVSNNGAVAAASYYLGKNQDALQNTIKKLASGKKLVDASTDPGTLSVSMKVNAAINRLSGAQNNIRNAIGFLEVQDGLLETTSKIVMRMSELKGYATQDPLKGETDIASYNNEFKDLQAQLYQISQMDFNGMSLFANHTTNDAGINTSTQAHFGGKNQDKGADNTIDIYTSSEGSSGPKVSIHKGLLLSALTIKQDKTLADDGAGNTQDWSTVDNLDTGDAAISPDENVFLTLAVDPQGSVTTLELDQVSAGVFEAVLENVVFLRAQTGGGLSRLNFALESIGSQETNMRAALGRIEDVDIAAEAANLSKYTILMQASAAMVAQANSTNDVALMLLRG
jgi:flagellin